MDALQQENLQLLSKRLGNLPIPVPLLSPVAAYALFADRLLGKSVYAIPYRAAGVLALLYYLLYRGLLAARSSQDRLGTYLSLLVVSWLTGQSAVNIGMVLGLLPTIGVPLPFVSYGGTALIAAMCGVGLIANVRGRRFVN